MAERIDMSLDEIIKDKKKQKSRPTNSSATGTGKTGPIRARTAGKKLTRQKANPYPKSKAVRPGDSNGIWRHDLFKTLNPTPAKRTPIAPAPQSGGLSLQQRLGGAGVTNRMSIKGAAGTQQNEFSFIGEGGPATIQITNLAPGTSANDIKSVFMEFGEIHTVDLKGGKNARPPINAEVTFETKASALAAINKYDQALVDGRVLKVQLKQAAAVTVNAGTASYRLRSKFPKSQAVISATRSTGKMYSDQLMGGASNSPNTRRVSGGKGKQPSFSVTL